MCDGVNDFTGYTTSGGAQPATTAPYYGAKDCAQTKQAGPSTYESPITVESLRRKRETLKFKRDELTQQIDVLGQLLFILEA